MFLDGCSNNIIEHFTFLVIEPSDSLCTMELHSMENFDKLIPPEDYEVDNFQL